MTSMTRHHKALLSDILVEGDKLLTDMYFDRPVPMGELAELFRRMLLSGFINEQTFDHPNIVIQYHTFVDAALCRETLDPCNAAFAFGQMWSVFRRIAKEQENDMRQDENGDPCPSTLGEYRDLCYALAPNSRAVEFLDVRIAKSGRDEKVLAPDSQMRFLLMPMLIQSREDGDVISTPKTPLKTTRGNLYREVAGFAIDLVSAGKTVMLDIAHDPALGDDDWKIVFVLTHPKGESTFLMYATPETRIVHLSTSAGEEIAIDDMAAFREYVRNFFS